MQGRILYVGNLCPMIPDRILKELFSLHGDVSEVRMLAKMGIAFIEMVDCSAAEKAKKNLDGFRLEGRDLIVRDGVPLKKKNKKRRKTI
ncbi:MAG: RNA-binding protein [candidate division Zixibacteria bacterium]